MFLCHLAARRQIALKFRDNAPSAVNFARLFGVEDAPLPICLSLDGLFACGPVFARCHLYDWRYIIVLKEADLPSVYNEFLGLAKLQPELLLSLQRTSLLRSLWLLRA